MKETIKCDYVLHAKYNGIQLGRNGQPIRNGEMTNKIAKELLEKHPRGAALFSKMPEIKEETPEPKKVEVENVEAEVKLSDLKLSELREIYPDIKANSKSKFLKEIESLDS